MLPKIDLLYVIELMGGYVCFPQWFSGFSAHVKEVLLGLGFPEELSGQGQKRFWSSYLSHSADKIVSHEFWIKTAVMFEETDIRGKTISEWISLITGEPDALEYIITDEFNARFGENIYSVWKAYTTAYAPLENYDVTENIDYTPLAKQTVTGTTKSSTSTNVDNSVYGFNSATAVPASESDSSTTQLKADNENEVVTSYDGGKDNTNTTRHGNIGVTSSQQLLEAEINVRKTEILELVFQGLDACLCEAVYD